MLSEGHAAACPWPRPFDWAQGRLRAALREKPIATVKIAFASIRGQHDLEAEVQWIKRMLIRLSEKLTAHRQER